MGTHGPAEECAGHAPGTVAARRGPLAWGQHNRGAARLPASGQGPACPRPRAQGRRHLSVASPQPRGPPASDTGAPPPWGPARCRRSRRACRSTPGGCPPPRGRTEASTGHAGTGGRSVTLCRDTGPPPHSGTRAPLLPHAPALAAGRPVGDLVPPPRCCRHAGRPQRGRGHLAGLFGLDSRSRPPPAAPEPVDVGRACELRRRRSRQLHRVPVPASTRPRRRPGRRREAACLTARGSFSTARTGELSWALTHSAFFGGDPPGAREGVRAAPPGPAQAGGSGSEDGGMCSQGPLALSRQACAEPSLGTRRR